MPDSPRRHPEARCSTPGLGQTAPMLRPATGERIPKTSQFRPKRRPVRKSRRRGTQGVCGLCFAAGQICRQGSYCVIAFTDPENCGGPTTRPMSARLARSVTGQWRLLQRSTSLAASATVAIPGGLIGELAESRARELRRVVDGAHSCTHAVRKRDGKSQLMCDAISDRVGSGCACGLRGSGSFV
jgi:hypothetical protein